MADFGFTIAAGRAVEFAYRVNNNDPANSALVIVAINANGVADATLQDLDDLAAVLATAANEVTNSGYSRKVLDNTSGITVTVGDAGNKIEVDIPDQTFTAVAAGDAWTDLLVCYDSDTTSGTDASIIPISCHDFVMTPDGSNLIATINASGIFRATV